MLSTPSQLQMLNSGRQRANGQLRWRVLRRWSSGLRPAAASLAGPVTSELTAGHLNMKDWEAGPKESSERQPVVGECKLRPVAFKAYLFIHIRGMSCPSWQWHRTGSRWFPVRTLPVAPLWCDLGFVPNSRGNKAAANLRPAGQSKGVGGAASHRGVLQGCGSFPKRSATGHFDPGGGCRGHGGPHCRDNAEFEQNCRLSGGGRRLAGQ